MRILPPNANAKAFASVERFAAERREEEARMVEAVMSSVRGPSPRFTIMDEIADSHGVEIIDEYGNVIRRSVLWPELLSPEDVVVAFDVDGKMVVGFDPAREAEWIDRIAPLEDLKEH